MKPKRRGASGSDSTHEVNQEKFIREMTKARRLGRDDVYADAFRGLCRSGTGDLDGDFAPVLLALDHAFAEKAGESRRLMRTKQTLNRYGTVHTLGELALKSKASDGFLKMLELGVADATAEMLVLKYRDQFDADVILAAENRLAEFGVLDHGA